MKQLLFILAAWTIAAASYAYEINDDTTGARDSTLFQRYPQSMIVSYQQTPETDYYLALGNAKTVNGVMVLDYSQRLAGNLTRITYRAPDDYPSEEVFKHFRSQLNQQPHKLLFECHSRECGDSSLWANKIFNISSLYGSERYQHYLAAQVSREGREYIVALYTIKRGNKRVYAQLDVLEVDPAELQDIAENPGTIISLLQEKGVFDLTSLEFDADDKLTNASLQSLGAIVSALKKSVRLEVYVVGHVTARQDINTLIARSLKRAESVRAALIAQGISGQRLSAHGVGPLAPLPRQDKAEGRIGLVLK